MNFKIIETETTIELVKTGDACLDGKVFGDLKMARGNIVAIVEKRIRDARLILDKELTEYRRAQMDALEARIKGWREGRDRLTTTKEKDLPTEPLSTTSIA